MHNMFLVNAFPEIRSLLSFSKSPKKYFSAFFWDPAYLLHCTCQSIILTHWGRVTHICVGNLTIIGPDNGLLPGRHQAIIRTNAGILSIEPLRTNFSEISIKIHTFSFKEMHLKMSSGKWRTFCLSLNVLNQCYQISNKKHIDYFFNGKSLPRNYMFLIRSTALK